MRTVITSRWAVRLMGSLLAIAAAAPSVRAQDAAASFVAALPTAEQVLADYYRAAGGLERLSAIRDVTVEWNVEVQGQPRRTAISRRMAPGSLHESLWNGAANVFTPDRVWRRRPDGSVMVDTGPGAPGAQLQAALEASRLAGLADQGIAARVTGADSADGEPAYRVEFSRGGATRVWLFGARSHLPVRVLLPAGNVFIRYGDYRRVDGVMEAHRVEITNGQPGNGIVFLLYRIRHDTGLTDADFQPPPGAPAPRPAQP